MADYKCFCERAEENRTYNETVPRQRNRTLLARQKHSRPLASIANSPSICASRPWKFMKPRGISGARDEPRLHKQPVIRVFEIDEFNEIYWLQERRKWRDVRLSQECFLPYYSAIEREREISLIESAGIEKSSQSVRANSMSLSCKRIKNCW